MNNKIKTILMAAIMSSVVLTQGVCVSAAQFDDGASAFSDGTGSVSALASTLAKQTEEQTQEFVAKEEEAAQIREERRVEKAEKASEKAVLHSLSLLLDFFAHFFVLLFIILQNQKLHKNKAESFWCAFKQLCKACNG